MLTIRGEVIEHTTNGGEEHIDKMAKKYLGLDKYPGRAPGEKRVLLKIKPRKSSTPSMVDDVLSGWAGASFS